MKKIMLIAFALVSFQAHAAINLKQFQDRPKLVVVLVIDQFRADYLTRFEKQFLPAEGKGKLGGFRYLMSRGSYFPFAKYDIMQSMTCPGHAMILTGSFPYQNSISLNDTYDRAKGRNVYCVEDPESPLVGSKEDAPVSPLKLKGTTVGDELKLAGFHSRVVTIALKDRAAIMLGGHRGDLALWLDSSFQWISSKYYLSDGQLPKWVEEQNKNLAAEKGKKYIFKSEGPGSGLSQINDPFVRETEVGSKYSLEYPLGARVTTDMAIAAIKAYKLGRGSGPDVLGVSYSGHDILGHDTSVDHREMEDLTIAEDQSIANLINAVKTEMGANFKDVVFVLTGDHGVSPNIQLMLKGRTDAGYIAMKPLQEEINAQLDEKFGKLAGGWIMRVHSFNFYLNTQAAADKKISTTALEDFVKAELLKRQGVAYAFSRTDYKNAQLPPGQHERQIMHTYLPGPNGDVVLIPKPFYVEDGHPSTHETGYNYDRTVPLIILSKNMKPGVYANEVLINDLAPTLSFLLGVLPPALSEGRVLHEAF